MASLAVVSRKPKKTVGTGKGPREALVSFTMGTPSWRLTPASAVKLPSIGLRSFPVMNIFPS